MPTYHNSSATIIKDGATVFKIDVDMPSPQYHHRNGLDFVSHEPATSKIVDVVKDAVIDANEIVLNLDLPKLYIYNGSGADITVTFNEDYSMRIIEDGVWTLDNSDRNVGSIKIAGAGASKVLVICYK